MDKDDGSWSIYRSKDNFSGEFEKNILKPLSFYVKDAGYYGG